MEARHERAAIKCKLQLLCLCGASFRSRPKRNKWREARREAPFMPDLAWRTSSRAEHSDRGLLRQWRALYLCCSGVARAGESERRFTDRWPPGMARSRRTRGILGRLKFRFL